MNTKERIRTQQNVSRETFSRLETYVAHLQKWNPKINLVAKNVTEDEIWQRHILDSLQLSSYIPNHHRILDLGSGGGLPGIVLACQGYDITMVESDVRKCVFLEEACRLCGLDNARVLNARIEDIIPESYNTITARALAPLVILLGYAQPHLGINAQCLFPKGKQYRMELEEARGTWQFKAHEHQSLTSSESVILQLTHIGQAA